MRKVVTFIVLIDMVVSCASCQRWVEQQHKLGSLSERYRKIYYGIKCIGTEDELDEFLSLRTDEERKDFLRRFWKRRDPTPTTEINERKLEHERRVKYAEQHFRIAGGGFWDERGTIYIKYGEPDERESHPMGEATWFKYSTKPWERWYYYYKYELRFDFVEEHNIYRLVAEADLYKSGHPGTRPLVYYPPKELPAEVATGEKTLSDYVFEKVTEFHEQLKEAPLEKYEPKYEGKHLKSILDIATFKDKEGKDRVELYYGVPFKELMTEANEVNLDITAVVFDKEEVAVARKEASRKSVVSSTRPDQFLIDQLTFDIPPGDYTLAVRLESKPANKLGIYKLAFKAPDYSGKPTISDIQFGSEIIPGKPRSHFPKDGVLIIPYPTKIVSRSSTLNIYYEIYNLALGDDNRTHFSVEYTIKPHKGKETISMTDILNKTKSPDTPKYLSWNLKDAKPGRYDLIITVEDLNSGKKDTALTTFMLIK